MAVQDDATVAAKRAAVIKAREVALQAKADAVRAKSRAKAEAIRHKAEEKATRPRQGRGPRRAHRGNRPGGSGAQDPSRRARTAQAIDERVDSRNRHATVARRRHRPDMPGPRRATEMGLRGVHDLLADPVWQLSRLPPRRLVAPRDRRAAAHRPREHLPAHRGHIYAGVVRARPAYA